MAFVSTPTQLLPLRAKVSRVSCWHVSHVGNKHGRKGLIVRNTGFRRKGAYILGRLWQISGSPCMTWLHCVTFCPPRQDDLPVSVGLHFSTCLLSLSTSVPSSETSFSGFRSFMTLTVELMRLACLPSPHHCANCCSVCLMIHLEPESGSAMWEGLRELLKQMVKS